MQRSNDQFTLLAVAPAVVLGLLIGFMLGGCSDIYFDRRDTISLAAGDAMAINRVTHDDRSLAAGERQQEHRLQRRPDAVRRGALSHPPRPAAGVRGHQHGLRLQARRRR